MAAYEFFIESATSTRTVKVVSVEGKNHAVAALRRKYSFESWRIINMAVIAGCPAIQHRSSERGGNTGGP